jgi:hypothetical protein
MDYSFTFWNKMGYGVVVCHVFFMEGYQRVICGSSLLIRIALLIYFTIEFILI